MSAHKLCALSMAEYYQAEEEESSIWLMDGRTVCAKEQ